MYPIWDMCIKFLFGDLLMKTQTTIRVDQNNYTQAKVILKYLGLSYSQAVNIFNSMIVFNKGLPFEIKIPNDETLQAMEEAKKLDGDFVTLDEFKKK
jgi:DNA-damage-inducible protein J